MYGQILERTPLFRGLGEEVIAELSRWVKDLALARDQVVYHEGKYGTELYFVVSGEVEVSQGSERLGFLAQGAFFGETPLIESVTGKGGNGSGIRKRTVRTVRSCDLGVLDQADVHAVMQRYPEMQIRLGSFLAVGRNFSEKGRWKPKMRDEFAIAVEKAPELKKQNLWKVGANVIRKQRAVAAAVRLSAATGGMRSQVQHQQQEQGSQQQQPRQKQEEKLTPVVQQDADWKPPGAAEPSASPFAGEPTDVARVSGGAATAAALPDSILSEMAWMRSQMEKISAENKAAKTELGRTRRELLKAIDGVQSPAATQQLLRLVLDIASEIRGNGARGVAQTVDDRFAPSVGSPTARASLNTSYRRSLDGLGVNDDGWTGEGAGAAFARR